VNTNLLNALKQIVSRHGGVETFSDARRVKALPAERLNREEGLGLMEAALFGEAGAVCPACGAAAAAPAPQKKEVWREPRTLSGHVFPVHSVAYSPGGRRIVSGSWDIPSRA
jgi:WD40 repeat protein